MRIRSTRGGILLDAVVAVVIVLLVAFVLNLFGVSFLSIWEGFERFFGV